MSRIRPLLNNLVSPFQATFVHGCKGIDNVIIAQEPIHSMQKKEKVAKVNSSLKLIWRRLMIGLSGASSMKFCSSLTFLLVWLALFLSLFPSLPCPSCLMVVKWRLSDLLEVLGREILYLPTYSYSVWST